MTMKNFNKKDTIDILGSRSRSKSSRNNGTGNKTNTKKRKGTLTWNGFIDKMKDIKETIMPILESAVGMFVSIVKAFKQPRTVYVNYAG